MSHTKNQPYKVLQLIDSLDMAGAQKIVYQLAVAANRSRFYPIVCSWRESGPYYSLLANKGITVETLMSRRRSIFLFPLFIFDILLVIFRLYSLTARHKVDIIHAHLVESSILGVLIGKLLRIPVIVSVHNTYILPLERLSPFRNWLRLAFIKTAFRLADILIAVGKDVKKSLETLIGKEKSVLTIINGVDYEEFAKHKDTVDIRKKLEIPKKNNVITFVGRLAPEKGLIYLIRAASQLIKTFPYLQVLMVGEGPLLQDLTKEVEKMGLSNNVRFLGQRFDIPEILSISDVFVLPSLFEAIPLVVLEAMASKIPTVATNIPGTRELITDGKEGFLVQPENISQLAKQIDKLLSTPDLANSMGKNAREKVKKLFTSKQMVQNVENCYQQVLEIRQKRI